MANINQSRPNQSNNSRQSKLIESNQEGKKSETLNLLYPIELRNFLPGRGFR